MTCSHAFSRAWRQLRAFASSSDWFTALSVVIGQSDHFGFVFYESQLNTALRVIYYLESASTQNTALTESILNHDKYTVPCFQHIKLQRISFRYCKIPIISPGLIFDQQDFLLGLFSGEPIFGGAYYWKEFCVSKWVGLDNKNSLKR